MPCKNTACHCLRKKYNVSFCYVFRDIDKVDELMQDITEQQELAQEISDAISKPVEFGEEFDEVRRNVYCTAIDVCILFCVCVLICLMIDCYFRMSCWLNWRSWSRKSWTRTFWRSEAQRMYHCPMCHPHPYHPDRVRNTYTQLLYICCCMV